MAKTLIRSPKLEIRTCDKRYGVFTNAPIEKNEVLEEAIVIPIPTSTIKLPSYIKEVSLMKKKIGDVATLEDYWFGFPEAGVGCLPSGFLFVCNHSSEANTGWRINKSTYIITLTAIKDIKEDEEITHDYGHAADFQMKPYVGSLQFTEEKCRDDIDVDSLMSKIKNRYN